MLLLSTIALAPLHRSTASREAAVASPLQPAASESGLSVRFQPWLAYRASKRLPSLPSGRRPGCQHSSGQGFAGIDASTAQPTSGSAYRLDGLACGSLDRRCVQHIKISLRRSAAIQHWAAPAGFSTNADPSVVSNGASRSAPVQCPSRLRRLSAPCSRSTQGPTPWASPH